MLALKRILLAEDSPPDAELTLAALAECHLANGVVHVQDGAQALEYLYHRGSYVSCTDGYPIVAILDLKMPKVDGLEVLHRMKSDPKLHTVPVVMLTSSREEQDLIKSYNLGANAYVVKPVDFEKFLLSIKQLGVFWALINEQPPLCDPDVEI